MTDETGSHDTPLIDWARRRWMVGEGEIEDARKLERNKLGTVFDDGLGGACEWVPCVFHDLPTPGEIKEGKAHDQA